MGAETVDCRSCSLFYRPLRRLRPDGENLSYEGWKFIDPCCQLRADDGDPEVSDDFIPNFRLADQPGVVASCDVLAGLQMSQILWLELFAPVDYSPRKHKHSVAAILECVRIFRRGRYVCVHRFPNEQALLPDQS